MEAEARRTTGIRQDLAAPDGAPDGAPAGRMDVAAIIADCLQPALEPDDAETMAERIVAALDAAARAKPERQYAPGDVVQINPEVDGFGASFLLVTEVLTWGVRGVVKGPVGGLQHVQVDFGRVEHTGGRAVWAPPTDAAGEGR
ncbi:hypothetical protein NS228_05885 [Methylobacterium indicum]|nr:hypothetical protein NS229_14950 [Methylobacterium indicum]KTS41499.1 hypothetical protein NS228_05885 [Methylobacterium indicum]KTS52447.1 hypothetical protein NS230_10030 [Methylobacterium indicum]